jgi:hypothetical protein
MTPADVLARALAAALLDGDWEHTPMRVRLRNAMGVERPWMGTLVRATRSRYATAPAASLSDLARWLRTHDAFRKAVAEGRQVIHYATPAPEMADSPWRVPPLATTRELATWIGIDIHTLEVLADRRGISRSSTDPRARHYRYAWIAKPSGGHRLVEAPKWRLRTAQRRVLDGILAHVPLHDAAHGFRAGRSIVTFAQQHIGRDVVLRVDLQAFFSSVFAARVRGILRTAGYPEEVSRTLAALCTHPTPSDVLAGAPDRDPIALARLRTPHLPQGAPTSGALANLAAYRLDVRIAGLAAKIGATYGRYADDRAPRRRGKEIARSNGRSLAAREMRAGPSGPGCRTRAQTTGCCFGPTTGVVSETEKAGPTRQVCAVKTNASEPSMTCRKRRDVHRNRAPVVGSGQTRGEPVDCSRGDRHEDGVSTAQALVRNVGTFCLDAKRELQAVDP